MRVRPPAVAGSFYPGEGRALVAAVCECLPLQLAPEPVPKAIIAPHAGYQYSGPVAGSAYARVSPARGLVSRVVLMGPSHRVAFRGLAVPSAASFATPIGEVPLDREAIARALTLPQVRQMDAAHAREHSLEVHLPFLQVTLGTFSLVPIVTGDSTEAETGEVLQRLWGGPETLIVVSSDLSHYHDYATASQMDARTSAAIEALRGEAIADEDACGCVAIRGLLWAARGRRLGARVLDVRNSGDTSARRDSVVGYGAYRIG
jgi:AmmeMemoRadiSam system protein B